MVRRKKLFAIGLALLLTGCINAQPKEVVTDPDGPSTGAIMGEEMKSAGFGFESQVKQYDVRIEGAVQAEQEQDLEIMFELFGTVDNDEENTELNGEIVIENQTNENQTVMLFENDQDEVTLAPSETYQIELSVYNQLPFSDRVAEAFQALGNHAGILEKNMQASTIHYSGEVYEQLEKILSLYWVDPYAMMEEKADESGPMTFELVVDAETKLAEKLTITDAQASFLIEFSNIEEGAPE